MKKKMKKLKTYYELQAEVAARQIQSKRFHQKVKGSGRAYNRQDNKRIANERTTEEG